MRTSRLLIFLGLLAVVAYFAFPRYQEYRLFQQAWQAPDQTKLNAYLEAFPEAERGDELKAHFDTAQIAELLRACDGAGPSFDDHIAGCCRPLQWHLWTGKSMYERKRYRDALEDCLFHQLSGQSDFERVRAYFRLNGPQGKHEAAIKRLAASLTIEQLDEIYYPPTEPASGPRDLVLYLEQQNFREPLPIYFDNLAQLPKPYAAYAEQARTLLEALIMNDRDVYLNGRQPKPEDFKQVANYNYTFQMDRQNKRNLESRLAEHLQNYLGSGRLKFEEQDTAPLERPRVEVTTSIHNLEDTIGGFVVPVLSINSSGEYSEKSGLREDFQGYSLTAELRITLKYYPTAPDVPPFIYYGRGTPNDQTIMSSLSNSSYKLSEQAKVSAFDNAAKDLMSQMYLQVKISY